MHKMSLKGVSADKLVAGKKARKRYVIVLENGHNFQSPVSHAVNKHGQVGTFQIVPAIGFFGNKIKHMLFLVVITAAVQVRGYHIPAAGAVFVPLDIHLIFKHFHEFPRLLY